MLMLLLYGFELALEKLVQQQQWNHISLNWHTSVRELHIQLFSCKKSLVPT